MRKLAHYEVTFNINSIVTKNIFTLKTNSLYYKCDISLFWNSFGLATTFWYGNIFNLFTLEDTWCSRVHRELCFSCCHRPVRNIFVLDNSVIAVWCLYNNLVTFLSRMGQVWLVLHKNVCPNNLETTFLTCALLRLFATSLAALLLRNSIQPSVKFLAILSRRLAFSFKSEATNVIITTLKQDIGIVMSGTTINCFLLSLT